MPGSDFATAELIGLSSKTQDELNATVTDHYYKVQPPANTDWLYLWTPDRRENLYLYDSSQALITSTTDSQTTALNTLNPTASSDYYIRVNRYSDGPYSLIVLASVDGVVINYSNVGGITENKDERGFKYQQWATEIDRLAPVTADNVHVTDPERVNYTSDVPPKFNFFGLKTVVLGSHQTFHQPIKSPNVKHYNIEGNVQRKGSAIPNALLRLYDRKTGLLIGETRSNGVGEYRFDTRLNADDKYYVIAFDDMEAPELQAVILDYLIPITQ